MEGAVGQSEDGGDRKRRRIALACSACRTRKSKCDGRRPRCTSCLQLGFECLYVQTGASSNVIVGKEYLSDIEERHHSVEGMLGALIEGLNERSPGAVRDALRQHDSHQSVFHPEPSTSHGIEDQADTEQAIVFAAEGTDGYFGPSSNIALTRQVARGLSQLHRRYSIGGNHGAHPAHGRGDEPMKLASQPEPRDDTPRPPRQVEELVQELAQNGQTRQLVEHYFQWTGLIYPYIHKPTFMRTLTEVEAFDYAHVRRTWLAMLYVILALATNIPLSNTQAAHGRRLQSERYFQTARILCDTEALNGTSLELVQYLLLTGQYLQGTQKSIKVWNTHGLAVKAALQLGLHSSEASKGFPPIEREVRKRTWYGCILLDRTLSMTFGRPCAIPNSYIRLEPVQQYQSSTLDVVRDRHELQSVDFVNASVDLYRIMFNIIDRLYGLNLGCAETPEMSDMVATALQLDQELVSWDCLLPDSMQLVTSSRTFPRSAPGSGNVVSERFGTILTLRRHNVHLLIHRPILVEVLLQVDPTHAAQENSPERRILQRACPVSIQGSYKSATATISIVFSSLVSNIDNGHQVLGAWWYTLYYTFNASLVIVIILLIHHKETATGTQSIVAGNIDVVAARNSIDDAVTALSRLDVGSRIALKCAEYLADLGRTIDTFDHRQQRQRESGLVQGSTAGSSGPLIGGDRPPLPTQRYPTKPEPTVAADATAGVDIPSGASDIDWDSFIAETGQEFFIGPGS